MSAEGTRPRIVLDFSPAASEETIRRPLKAPPVPAPQRRPVAPGATLPPVTRRAGIRPASVPPRAEAATQVASLGSRFAAMCIDSLIVGLPTGIAVSVLLPLLGAALAPAATDAGGAATAIEVFFVLWITFAIAGAVVTALYSVILLSRAGEHNGQTFGKQVMRIRVVRVGGGEMTSSTAVMRELVWRQLVFSLLSALLFWIPTVVDALWVFANPDRCALHDKGAGTIVVRG